MKSVCHKLQNNFGVRFKKVKICYNNNDKIIFIVELLNDMITTLLFLNVKNFLSIIIVSL